MGQLKSLKKPIFWLGLVAVLVWAAVWQCPDPKLHLVFCSVGQGDAILAVLGDEQILVDGGPNRQVLDCLSRHLPFYDRTIEMVVLSHPDADHVTGLIDVLEGYEVKQLVINSHAEDTDTWREFQKAVLAEGAAVYFPQKGDRINLGSLQMAVLWPESQDKVLGATTIKNEANETSVAMKLTFGQFDALLPGDLSSKIEPELDLSEVEVLKVAHHGSKYATGTDFLNQVRPDLAVISVGKNSFGHPTDEVLERLKQAGSEVLRTDQSGDVEVVTDGERREVQSLPNSKASEK